MVAMFQHADSAAPHAWEDLVQSAEIGALGQRLGGAVRAILLATAALLVVGSPAMAILHRVATEFYAPFADRLPALTIAALAVVELLPWVMVPLGFALLFVRHHWDRASRWLGVELRVVQQLRLFAALSASGVPGHLALGVAASTGPWFQHPPLQLTEAERTLASLLTRLHGDAYAAHALSTEMERHARARIRWIRHALSAFGVLLGLILVWNVVLPFYLPVFRLAGSLGGE
ncbi:MAG: hypothetical protein AB2A00_05120 [Myxococcota bacterium]